MDGGAIRLPTIAQVAACLITISHALSAQSDSRRGGIADSLRLDLAGARALAMRANPELRAARLDTTIARGELRQASVLLQSNPSADVLTRGLGAEVGLSQEIEVAGQRGARRAAGIANVERARAGVIDAMRTTIGEVDRSFYRLIAVGQQRTLADSVVALNARLADAAARQLKAGDISQLEYNLATVEYGRSRARALASRREQENAASDLRRLLGVGAEVPVAPIVDLPARADTIRSSQVRRDSPAASLDNIAPDSLSIDSLTRLALDRRPDLQERAAAVTRARAQASLARREAFPNLLLRASSERLEGSDNRVLRPGFGITLPAFNLNRGEVQARRAEAEQADLDREALVARIRIDVRRALVAYRSAASEADVLDQTVLIPARENRRLLEIAYRAGKVGLPELLLIRNQVSDAEREYWEAWLAQRVALADLDEITAANVAGLIRATP